ncbi:MAG: cytidine deaminase [Ruminococcus sp.]|nr:cytidine deaminase [Ruminococcus sp.]
MKKTAATYITFQNGEFAARRKNNLPDKTRSGRENRQNDRQIESINAEKLLNYAHNAMKNAHSPYTGYISGAAILGADGVVYTGCYVENADSAATICAECAAVAKAVSRGCREFFAIAVTAGRGGTAIPCKICRKVLAEFSTDLTVIMETADKKPILRKLYELMPGTFCIKI